MFYFSSTWTADGSPSLESQIVRMRVGCARQLATRHSRRRDLNGRRYLLHDRDAKFCVEFRETLAAGGVKCLRLPPRSPNLKGYASHCTSWVPTATTPFTRRRLDSFTPCALRGGLSPGCSNRRSLLSL